MQGRYSWISHVPKVCREDCLRLDVESAPAHGVEVSQFRNVSGVHLLCVCPDCGKRSRYLYRPPIVREWHRYTPRETLPHAPNWACAACHQLAFRSSQRSGTRAAMQKARERDFAEFQRLLLDSGPENGVSFEAFQKWRHRSYNRKKAKNRFQFGKIAQSVSTTR